MAYLHIENCYRNYHDTFALFRECYALEKIDGTSAHVAWRDGQVHFFSGGVRHDSFVKLFDKDALAGYLGALGHESVTVYGEAYGGKCQGMAHRYGKELRFVAFDVKIGDCWLDVPNAERVVKRAGLEFVHYVRIPTDIAALDAERDATSEQARRNGIEG